MTMSSLLIMQWTTTILCIVLCGCSFTTVVVHAETPIPCNSVVNEYALNSSEHYVVSGCADATAAPMVLTCQAPSTLSNTTVVITDSLRPVLFDFSCPLVDNVSITFVNVSFTINTSVPLLKLRSVKVLNSLRLTLAGATIVKGQSQLLFSDTTVVDNGGQVFVNISENSRVELVGATAIQIQNANVVATRLSNAFTLSVTDSTLSVVLTSNISRTAALMLLVSTTVPFTQTHLNFVRANVVCQQQNLPDFYNPSNFGCVYFNVIYANGLPHLSVNLLNSSLQVQGMPPSLTSGYSEAHFLIISAIVSTTGPVNPFPTGYSSCHEVHFRIEGTTALFRSEKNCFLYGDLCNFINGSFTAHKATVQQLSLLNSSPIGLFRVSALLYVTAQTGFQDFAVSISDSRVTHRMLSGAVWANDTAALLQLRSLSNVRSALLYLSYLVNTRVVVVNSHLVARLADGAFVQRGPRESTATPDPKIGLPLGIISCFLVQLQSEAAITVASSTVEVTDSTVNATFSLAVSTSIISNQDMFAAYTAGVSVYGYSTAIVYMTSVATNMMINITRSYVYQYSVQSLPWWTTLRNSLSTPTLLNTSAIVVCQAVEASLSSKVDVALKLYPAGAIYLTSFSSFIQSSAAVAYSTTILVTNCTMYVEPLDTWYSSSSMFTTPTSVAMASAIILPNFLFDGTRVEVSGFSADDVHNALSGGSATTGTWLPFVSFFGMISLSNASGNVTVTVSDSSTRNGGIIWTTTISHVLFGAAFEVKRTQVATLSVNPAASPVSPNLRFYGSLRTNSGASQIVLENNEFSGFSKVFTPSYAAAYVDAARNTMSTVATVVNMSSCNSWNSGPMRIAHIGLASSAVVPYEPSTMQLSGDNVVLHCAMSHTASLMSTKTAVIPPPPPYVPYSPPTSVAAVASAAGVVVAVVASQMQTSNSIFLQVAMLAIRLINGGSCEYDVTIMESPTGLVIGTESDDALNTAPRLNGAIIGNTILVMCAAVVIVICGCSVVYLEVRQQRRLGALSPETLFVSTFPLWRRVCIRAALPGALVAPLSLVLEPVVSASIANLVGGNTGDSKDDVPVSIALGVIGLLLYGSVTVWLVWNAINVCGCRAIARPRSEAHIEIRTSEDNCWAIAKKLLHRFTVVQFEWKATALSDGKGAEKQRTSSRKHPSPLVSSKLHLAHFGPTFEAYCGHRRSWFFAIEFGVGIVCGLIGGLAPKIGCTGSLWVLLVVSVLIFIAGAIASPYTSMMLHVTFIFNAVATALVCLIAVISVYSSNDDSSSSSGGGDGAQAALIITYMQLLLNGVQMIIDWVGGLLHGTSRLSKLLAIVKAILGWRANVDPSKLFGAFSGGIPRLGASHRSGRRLETEDSSDSTNKEHGAGWSGRVSAVEAAHQLELLIVMITEKAKASNAAHGGIDEE